MSKAVEVEYPKKWSKWRHKSGRLYRVLDISNTQGGCDRYPVTVIYENIGGGGSLWSRPLSLWYASMTNAE